MMKSPAMKSVGIILWALTSLGALHVGLMAMGYNLLAFAPLMSFAKPIEYIIGIAGLISFVLLVMHGGCCACADCNCGSGR